MSGSLRRRLVLSACLWVVAASVAGGFALDLAFRSAVTRSFDETLAEELRALVAGVESARDGTWWLTRPPDDPDYRAIYSGRYWQIDDAGVRTERSRSLWDERLPSAATSAGDGMRFQAVAGPGRRPLRMAEQAIVLPHMERALRFQIAHSSSALAAETAAFTRLLALALSLLALGLVLAVWLQVRFGLRPLRRLAGDVRAVREGRQSGLPADAPLEIQPLVLELTAVLDHNQRLVERARSSSADLAHALKTPLSVMAAELHDPGPDWRSVLTHELGRTRELVNRHLGRAALAGAGRGRRTPLAPVVDELLRAMARIHGHRGIGFDSGIAPALFFAGDREDLEELLGNLLDNAGKWARSTVRIQAQAAGDERLRVVVMDDGPGIPEHLRAQLGERGRRLDQQAPGSGLGLAIAGDIVASVDGRMELGDGEQGGLRVQLDLPGGSDRPDDVNR